MKLLLCAQEATEIFQRVKMVTETLTEDLFKFKVYGRKSYHFFNSGANALKICTQTSIHMLIICRKFEGSIEKIFLGLFPRQGTYQKNFLAKIFLIKVLFCLDFYADSKSEEIFEIRPHMKELYNFLGKTMQFSRAKHFSQ